MFTSKPKRIVKRPDAAPAPRTVTRPTPIRNAIMVWSLTSLAWTFCLFYGVHTGHIHYYSTIQVPNAPMDIADASAAEVKLHR